MTDKSFSKLASALALGFVGYMITEPIAADLPLSAASIVRLGLLALMAAYWVVVCSKLGVPSPEATEKRFVWMCATRSPAPTPGYCGHITCTGTALHHSGTPISKDCFLLLVFLSSRNNHVRCRKCASSPTLTVTLPQECEILVEPYRLLSARSIGSEQSQLPCTLRERFVGQPRPLVMLGTT
jgi:hypothetical protein